MANPVLFSRRTSSRTHKHVRFPFIETWTAAESARKEQEEELKLGTLFRECFKEEDEEDEEEHGERKQTFLVGKRKDGSRERVETVVCSDVWLFAHFAFCADGQMSPFPRRKTMGGGISEVRQ